MTIEETVRKKIDAFTESKIERGIAKIFPQMAERRLKSAVNHFIISSYWESASTKSSTFEEYSPGIADIDSSLAFGERSRMVDRSHAQIRNTPIAAGLVNRIVNHSVGPNGLIFHPQIDADVLGMNPKQKLNWERQASSWFRMWAESVESDFERKLNFYEQTNLALRSELSSGDCFDLILDLKRPGSPFRTKTQLVEGERVSNPDNLTNSDSITEGIEKSEDGVPEFYHFSKYHPGNVNSSGRAQKWDKRRVFGEKTGQRYILHHFVQQRPGQTRGIPILGPITEKLLNLNRYSKAELLAAVLNSYYTLVITGEKQNTDFVKTAPIVGGITRTSDQKLTLGSGSIFRIGQNEKVEGFDPARPNHLYMPFFESLVMEIGAYCGVPKSIILMAFDKSYSASRGEVILFWVTVLAYRVRKAIGRCQPIWEALLDELVADGKIYAPGYFRDERIRRAYRGSGYDQWAGPVREAIDELVEARAAEIKIKNHLKSRKMIAAEKDAKDWETVVFKQLAHENQLLKIEGMDGSSDSDLLQDLQDDSDNQE